MRHDFKAGHDVRAADSDRKGHKRDTKLCPFAPSGFPLIPNKAFGINGRDDGARTRDLCRDTNLLKLGVTDGSFGALRNVWPRLLHP